MTDDWDVPFDAERLAEIDRMVPIVLRVVRLRKLERDLAAARKTRVKAARTAGAEYAGNIVAKAEGIDKRYETERRVDAKAAKKRKSYDTIRAERAIDPVYAMARKNQLDDRQMMAARILRDAFDTVGGSLGGTLDLDKVRGIASGSPSPTMLAAADTLIAAGKRLGELQGSVVVKIVCVGLTISECSLSIHGDTGDRRRRSEDRTFTARLFRRGLDALADAWVPQSRASRIRASLPPDARPVAQSEMRGEVERGHVAHATSRRVVHG